MTPLDKWELMTQYVPSLPTIPTSLTGLDDQSSQDLVRWMTDITSYLAGMHRDMRKDFDTLVDKASVSNENWCLALYATSNGNGGGDAIAGGVQQRALNSFTQGSANLYTLANSNITVPPGLYYAYAYGVFYDVASAKVYALFANYDGGGNLFYLNGPAIQCAANSSVYTSASGYCRANVQCEVRFMYIVGANSNTNGLGYPASTGTERYAYINLWRVSD